MFGGICKRNILGAAQIAKAKGIQIDDRIGAIIVQILDRTAIEVRAALRFHRGIGQRSCVAVDRDRGDVDAYAVRPDLYFVAAAAKRERHLGGYGIVVPAAGSADRYRGRSALRRKRHHGQLANDHDQRQKQCQRLCDSPHKSFPPRCDWVSGLGLPRPHRQNADRTPVRYIRPGLFCVWQPPPFPVYFYISISKIICLRPICIFYYFIFRFFVAIIMHSLLFSSHSFNV